MSTTPPADYRNLVISSLGILTVAMGTMIAGTWNDTTAALAEVARVVATNSARLDAHAPRIDRIENRFWEDRQ